MFVDTLAAASVAQSKNKTQENSGPSFDNFLLEAAQNNKKVASPDNELSAAQITHEEILDKGFSKWT